MITVLIPVLARPQNAERVARSIRENTSLEHTIVFLVTPADLKEHYACCNTGVPGVIVDVVSWDAGKGDWAKKINYGVTHYDDEFFLLGADDLLFHPQWDIFAIATYVETRCRVIGTNDLGNATVMRGDHSTHPLVHSSYVSDGTWDEPGKLLHEGYAHQWVDTELVQTAMIRGEWAFSRQSHVEHMHPFWPDGKGGHKGAMDKTYEKALSTSRDDNQLYRRREPMWRAGLSS